MLDIINDAVKKYRRRRRDMSPLRSLTFGAPITLDKLFRFKPKRAWRRLEQHEQDALKTRALISDDASMSIAFTQNLGHGWIADLCHLDCKDPIKKHADELNRRMQEVMGFKPPLMFRFDTDDDARLHVHGVVNLPAIDQETIDKLLLVLEKAGGYHHHRQGYLDVHTSHGWRDYYARNRARTSEVLGTDKISYCSHSLTRLAREAHEADRAPKIDGEHGEIVRRLEVKPKLNMKKSSKPDVKPELNAAATHSESDSATDASPAPEGPKPAKDSQRASTARSQRVRDAFTIDQADIPAVNPYSPALMAEIDALLDAL